MSDRHLYNDADWEFVVISRYIRAVERNDLDAIRAFHREGLDINTAAMFSGRTGLHIAAAYGTEEVFRYFLDNPDVNPWLANSTNETPNISARNQGHWCRAEEIERLMVRKQHQLSFLPKPPA